MPSLRSPLRLRAGSLAVLMVIAAAPASLMAQGFAAAVGRVTLEKPVGATVVNGVLAQVSLPSIGPVGTVPAGPGSLAGSALSPEAAAIAPGQGNLITLFSNGDTQLVSDTTISVRVAPVAPQDIESRLGDSSGGRGEGPVMVLAQFN